jgi:hypothetical protein
MDTVTQEQQDHGTLTDTDLHNLSRFKHDYNMSGWLSMSVPEYRAYCERLQWVRWMIQTGRIISSAEQVEV